jgi:hypothetical protein
LVALVRVDRARSAKDMVIRAPEVYGADASMSVTQCANGRLPAVGDGDAIRVPRGGPAIPMA